MSIPWRKTTQELAPAYHIPVPAGQYDLYPGFPIDPGEIDLGYGALAQRLKDSRTVIVDGYGGVFWESFREALDAEFKRLGLHTAWLNINVALRSTKQIEQLVEPFLGGDDPLFGTRFTGKLDDFFDASRLLLIQPDPAADISLVYGCGAALCGWQGMLVYIDLPKNETQFRARAGSIANLGQTEPIDPKVMYKRFYFVDWVALNQHKYHWLPHIDVIVDAQRPDEPTSMSGATLRRALTQMSQNYFRARPWFEPGAWGGQWIKQKIPQLPQSAPNYAWSFELISPENGLMFESDDRLLEVSFDCLMAHAHREVLGTAAERFGLEFPIRFDFLDTFDGGNLSVQCHPRPAFAREHFGENFTQDETYYILDCDPAAQVYLGFREDIDPVAFRAALERSFNESVPVDVERFVNVEPAHKHDLFLIPHGTIHCSGVNNLVLEISATPYIFTFKMYDWMRLDLDGKPRPLNIERAFQNLNFSRKGERARQELVSKPHVLSQGKGWQIVDLPTHPEHFYGIHRLEFTHTIEVATEDSCHILSLVEGESITLETAHGLCQRFSYAETFIVPAAAQRYILRNEQDKPVKVVKAFVKPDAAAGRNI